MLNTLFLTLKLSHLDFLLSFSTHKHMSIASLVVMAEDVSAFSQHQKFPPHARKTSGTLGMASQATLSNFFKVARPSIFVGTPSVCHLQG